MSTVSSVENISFSQAIKNENKALLKTAVAVKVDGKLFDLSSTQTTGEFEIIHQDTPEGVDIIRHSTAHLLAMAVKQLYPSAQVTIGPVIENGFYYDFSYKDGFNQDDLAKIERQMKKLVKKRIPISRAVQDKKSATTYFRSIGEEYKAEIIESIPGDEELSMYQQDDFIDLCRGPHVPHTGMLGAFKLLKTAGAYWRGDSDNEMLQRIYGTAFESQEKLDAHLHMLEEAEKRDHRKLGKQLDLFHLQEEAPGMVFWHPKGWQIYTLLEQFIRKVYKATGYQEIKTPQVIDRKLWEKSGHWDKYSENMFTVECEKNTYAIKPMSCPGHVQVFNQGLKSYKELPLRLAEFGCCHRNEASGTLHGLMRVRGFTQDDGHIFCSMDQIGQEVLAFVKQTYSVYQVLGFDNIILCVSTRPEKRVGSDEVWDKAENALISILDDSGYKYELLPGEGAFYGPKIEFSLKDSLGRVWQCGTIQVDFSMPERLDARFVNEKGEKEMPVMLHRAILGTFERFIGIMIENYVGHMPFWLSPVQIALLPIGESHHAYCEELRQELEASGYRVVLDDRSEKISYKIRQHTLERSSLMFVIGDQEVESNAVNIRDSQMQQHGSVPRNELSEWLGQFNNPLDHVEKLF